MQSLPSPILATSELEFHPSSPLPPVYSPLTEDDDGADAPPASPPSPLSPATLEFFESVVEATKAVVVDESIPEVNASAVHGSLLEDAPQIVDPIPEGPEQCEVETTASGDETPAEMAQHMAPSGITIEAGHLFGMPTSEWYGTWASAVRPSTRQRARSDRRVTNKRPRLLAQMVPVAYRVDQFCVNAFYSKLRGNWAFNFLSDQAWAGVCPQGIDVTYRIMDRTLTPPRALSEEVNGHWRRIGMQIVRSILAVGYALVVYGPAPRLNGGFAPTVLEPDEYMLEWTMDQNGVRYYVPRPTGPLMHVNPVDDLGRPVFQMADVFFATEPSHRCLPRSRAFTAFDSLVLIDQLFLDFRVMSHERNNQPFIIQSREPSHQARQVGGDPRVAPFGGRGSAGEYGTPYACQGTAHSAERALGLHTFTMAALTSAESRTRQTMVQNTVDNSRARARLSKFLVGDTEDGTLYELSPDPMWLRSLLPLPVNAEVAHTDSPDLPSEFSNILRLAISIACSIFGVPGGIILDAMGGGRQGSGAENLTREMTNTTVREWQNLLGEVFKKMYWRVYSEEEHNKFLAVAAASDNYKLSRTDAAAAALDDPVTFTFRTKSLDMKTVKGLFNDEVLSGEAYAKFVMREYGASSTDVLIPLTPTEKMERQLKFAADMRGGQTHGVSAGAAGVAGTAGMDEVDSVTGTQKRKVMTGKEKEKGKKREKEKATVDGPEVKRKRVVS